MLSPATGSCVTPEFLANCGPATMNAFPQTIVPSIKSWANAALAFVYPECCQLCGHERATPAQGFVCADCRAKVQFIEPPFCECCGHPFQGALSTKFECANCRETNLHFRFARSAVAARDEALEAIHQFKYNRALWLEPFLAALLITKAKPELTKENWNWLVPIPLHTSKQRQREFNQAGRLALRLSAATEIPLNTRLIRRVLATRTQTLLTREERRANMRNAFAMRSSERLNGERIVLVDNVFTTGATANDCARALRQAGAADVCVWTVARGI